MLLILVYKATNAATCSAAIPCDYTLGLSCVSNTCQCSNTYYWNGATCGNNQ